MYAIRHLFLVIAGLGNTVVLCGSLRGMTKQESSDFFVCPGAF